MANGQRSDLLVWVDLEMTSIQNALVDRITEIAVVLTDKDLSIVAEGPEIIIQTDPALFDRIPQGAREMYDNNNLEQKAIESTIPMEEAEERVLAFLEEHVAPQTAPLCGNSIWVDRHFLALQMPKFEDYLFYRCIDVSSIKELARRWNGPVYEEAERRKGEKPHRAKADIINSIEELKYYRDMFFTKA